MTMIFDDFVEQLLYDVTLAGNEGVAVEELERGVHAFAESQIRNQQDQSLLKNTDSLSLDAPLAISAETCNSLIDAVWNWLEKHPDIQIKAKGQKNASLPQPEGGEASRIQSLHPTDLAPQKLTGKRVFARNERIWNAIAGHPKNTNLVPYKEFDLLSIIAAHGPEGVLQPALTKLAQQDKRSVPKRTDDLAAKGYISKDKVIVTAQQTAILKLLKFTNEGVSGPRHVWAFPDKREASEQRLVYYDIWYEKFIRMLIDNNGIITLQDVRVGLGIDGQIWGRRAVTRCIERLVEHGLVRKLKAKVAGETGRKSDDCWMNCVQLLREPNDADRLAFSGAHDSERTKRLRSKFSASRSNNVEMLENVSDDNFDEECSEEDEIIEDEDTEEGDSDHEAESDDPVPEANLSNAGIEHKQTTTVDRSGNVVTYTVVNSVAPPDESELEEWGFLKTEKRLVEGREDRMSLFEWQDRGQGQLRLINPLENLTRSQRSSALLKWTSVRKSRRRANERSSVLETSRPQDLNGATRETTFTARFLNPDDFRPSGVDKGAEVQIPQAMKTTIAKRTADDANLEEAGAAMKAPRSGRGALPSVAPDISPSISSEQSTKAESQGMESRRLRFGVTINPADAWEARFTWRKRPGPRPKSIVAVFKSNKLNDFPWFQKQAAEVLPAKERRQAQTSVATLADHSFHGRSDSPGMEQRQSSEDPIPFSQVAKAREAVQHKTQRQCSTRTLPTIQDSSPFDTAPAFSTRRSHRASSPLLPSRSRASSLIAQTELPLTVRVPVPVPERLVPTGGATTDLDGDSTIPKKRKRGRPSKADVVERKRLMLQKDTGRGSLIVKLPVEVTPLHQNAADRMKHPALLAPKDSESAHTETTVNQDTNLSPSRIITLSMPPTSLSGLVSGSLRKPDNSDDPNRHGTYSRQYKLQHPETVWKHRGKGRYIPVSPATNQVGSQNASSLEHAADEPQSSPRKIVKFSVPISSRSAASNEGNTPETSDPMTPRTDVVNASVAVGGAVTVPTEYDVNTHTPTSTAAQVKTKSSPEPSHEDATSKGRCRSSSNVFPVRKDGEDVVSPSESLLQGIKHDQTRFPAIEGVTVRRTAAGLAVSNVEIDSESEVDSLLAQQPKRKSRKRRKRRGASRRSTEMATAKDAHLFLIMTPDQLFYESSGTIGTTGIGSFSNAELETLQEVWKKHHAVPEDLHGILNSAKRFYIGEASDNDASYELFLREVECARIWEENLVKEGCFLEAGHGQIFINHGLDCVYPPAAQYESKVDNSDFIAQAPPVLTSSVSKHAPGKKNTKVKDPHAVGKGQLLVPSTKTNRNNPVQSNVRSLTNDSTPRLYPGPDLPKVLLLPLSRNWTPSATTPNPVSGPPASVPQTPKSLETRANSHSETPLETSEAESTEQSTRRKRGKNVNKRQTPTPIYPDNANLGEERCTNCARNERNCYGGSPTEKCNFCRATRSRCSRVEDGQAKPARSAEERLAKTLHQPQSKATAQHADATTDLAHASVSLGNRCERCSKFNKNCIAGSTIERCGFCKASASLCSKVEADRTKLFRWGRLSNTEPNRNGASLNASAIERAPAVGTQPVEVPSSTYGDLKSIIPAPIEQSVGQESALLRDAKPKQSYTYRTRKNIKSSAGGAVDEHSDQSAFATAIEQVKETGNSFAARPKQMKAVNTTKTLPKPDLQRLCVAVALVDMLAGGVEPNTAPIWDIVSHALSFRYDKMSLQNKWIYQKTVNGDFMNRVQEALRVPFLSAYENGEIPAIDYKHLNKTNWPALLQWAEDIVLPLDAEDESCEFRDLPGSRQQLEAKYEIMAVKDQSKQVSIKVGSTQMERDSQSLGVTSDSATGDCDLIIAKSWVRALVTTKEVKYDSKKATSKLQTLGTEIVRKATTELENSETLVRKKAGRQLPGRNYIISEHCLSQFARWADDENDSRFWSDVASARANLVKHFEQYDQFETSPDLSIPNKLVLDHMVEQGLLKRTVDIKRIQDCMRNGKAVDVDVTFVKTSEYSPDHGLRCGVVIPSEPRSPLDGAIPFWVDIHGNLLEEVWDMVLRSILYLLVHRSGITMKGIEAAHNGQLWFWEVQMALVWMEKTGLAEKIEIGRDIKVAGNGRWKATKWWCYAFLPEVAKWKDSVEIMGGTY